MKRVYIDTQGPDYDAAKKVVQEAIKVSKVHGPRKIVFLTPTLGNTEWLEEIFSEKVTGNLRDGITTSGITFSRDSRKTFDEYNDDCLVVTYALSSDDIFELENINRIKGIFAIPWMKDGCLDWAEGMGALEINSGKRKVKKGLNCVVEKALDQLSNSVNKTGLHSSDKDQIKTFLRALNKHDYSLNENTIKAYLASNNWSTKSIDYFISHVEKLNSGSYFQGGSKTGLNKLVKKWKEECEDT